MTLAIDWSPDFERVLTLPRRAAPGSAAAQRLAEQRNAELTEALLTPEGRRAGARLIGWQGYLLHEALETESKPAGAFGQLPVGSGKTLISLLIARLLGCGDTALVLPESLVEKTYREFAEYSRFWKRPTEPVHVIGYREMTLQKNLEMLSRLAPKLLVLDEADKASNQDASVAQRIGRYVGANDTAVITLSGTGSRHEIQDISHLLTWSLKSAAPVPLSRNVLEQWGLALNAKTGFRTSRLLPGVLHDLAPIAEQQTEIFTRHGVEMDELVWARLAFQTRLRETPGVVIVDEDSCDQPLEIRLIHAPEDKQINALFERYSDTSKTPDEWVLACALERYTFESQLGMGFHYYYDPRPPEPWLDARRALARFVSSVKRSSRRGRKPLDTEGAVLAAHADAEPVRDWLAIEPTFAPVRQVGWHSDSVVDAAVAWSRAHCGLIFCKYPEVGKRIAEAADLEYYGAKGRSASGELVDDAPKNRCAVLSLDANIRGRNLQGWSRALGVGCPQSARDIEQWLGRLHRYGQTKPVRYDIMLTSALSEYALNSAIDEALFVLQTQGQSQKLLRAQITRHGVPSRAKRWTTVLG